MSIVISKYLFIWFGFRCLRGWVGSSRCCVCDGCDFVDRRLVGFLGVKWLERLADACVLICVDGCLGWVDCA
jgi:hypothetical protein